MNDRNSTCENSVKTWDFEQHGGEREMNGKEDSMKRQEETREEPVEGMTKEAPEDRIRELATDESRIFAMAARHGFGTLPDGPRSGPFGANPGGAGVVSETGRAGMGVGAIDASLCLRGLQEAGTLACATRGTDGSPRVRYLSALHFELDAVYLLASRGMPFAQQLLADPRLQLLGAVRKGVSVRLTGTAEPAPEEEQVRWRLRIFQECPEYRELYPPSKHDDSLVFLVRNGFFEYLDLTANPIDRVYVPFGEGRVVESGYRITDACARCGTCQGACPERCIVGGTPFRIVQEHCLQCGACKEACPRGAIERIGG